jgi:hypothetical protein
VRRFLIFENSARSGVVRHETLDEPDVYAAAGIECPATTGTTAGQAAARVAGQQTTTLKP